MDSRLRGNDVVVSFNSPSASISVRSVLLRTFYYSVLREDDVTLPWLQPFCYRVVGEDLTRSLG